MDGEGAVGVAVRGQTSQGPLGGRAGRGGQQDQLLVAVRNVKDLAAQVQVPGEGVVEGVVEDLVRCCPMGTSPLSHSAANSRLSARSPVPGWRASGRWGSGRWPSAAAQRRTTEVVGSARAVVPAQVRGAQEVATHEVALDAGHRGVVHAAYQSSKTALNVLTVLAKELREAGVKVNAVSPGYRATELNGGLPTPGAGTQPEVRRWQSRWR